MGQTRDNARRPATADKEFDDFMASLFGGADNQMPENTPAILDGIDRYLSEHYGAAGADGEIDVRAHLIESELTVKTPPDVKTVAALRALADALEWALQNTADAPVMRGDGARL